MTEQLSLYKFTCVKSTYLKIQTLVTVISMFQVPKQTYHISMKSNQVYDISERKVFILLSAFGDSPLVRAGRDGQLVGVDCKKNGYTSRLTKCVVYV